MNAVDHAHKEIYIDSALRALPVGVRALPAWPEKPREWLFSQGEKWLRLTPPRFRRLAEAPGLEDNRVAALFAAVRRWHPHPEEFCRAAGLREVRQVHPRNYTLVICPRCGHVHRPHPEDAASPCPGCAGKSDARPPRRVAELKADALFRERLRRDAPGAFDDGILSPNWRLNKKRRLERDWNTAVNRILLGWRYREIAEEFKCSVGVLHKKVCEAKYWEWN